MDGMAAGTNVAAASQGMRFNNVCPKFWSSFLYDYSFYMIYPGDPQTDIDQLCKFPSCSCQLSCNLFFFFQVSFLLNAKSTSKKKGEPAWKGRLQYGALLKLSSKAALWLIPPVNLPFNWRGHTRGGAASITNVFCLEPPGTETLCLCVCMCSCTHWVPNIHSAIKVRILLGRWDIWLLHV